VMVGMVEASWDLAAVPSGKEFRQQFL
jgi:hypothetical protein